MRDWFGDVCASPLSPALSPFLRRRERDRVAVVVTIRVQSAVRRTLRLWVVPPLPGLRLCRRSLTPLINFSFQLYCSAATGESGGADSHGTCSDHRRRSGRPPDR